MRQKRLIVRVRAGESRRGGRRIGEVLRIRILQYRDFWRFRNAVAFQRCTLQIRIRRYR